MRSLVFVEEPSSGQYARVFWRQFAAALLLLSAPSAARPDWPVLSTTSSETTPIVAYNIHSDEYLLAYSLGGYSVVQRISADGTPIGSSVYPWGSLVIAGGEVDLVYNAHVQEYLLVSTDLGVTPPYIPRVIGLRLDTAAAPLGTPFTILQGAVLGAADCESIRVALNTLANEYYVTAHLSTGGGMGDVYGQRVSETGMLIGAPINVTDGPFPQCGWHALAYAPISSPETPTGRYLFVRHSRLHMLDSEGKVMVVVFTAAGDPVSAELPFDFDNVHDGEVRIEAAYGELEGQKRFYLVWEDHNNDIPTQPGIDWTGIWQSTISAEEIHYCTPLGPVNVVCSLSWIWEHYTSVPEGTPWWVPRVAYNPEVGEFVVTWRETPTTNELNDPKVNHIRAARTSSLMCMIPPNMVISAAQSSTEDPLAPALAVGNGGRVLILWDDNRNAASNARDIFGNILEPSPPANDTCTAALPITEGEYNGTLAGATVDGESSCAVGSGAPDVWYQYTAVCNGVLRVNTCGTNDIGGVDTGMDTILSVHAGCPGTSGNDLVCNDDWPSSSEPAACAGLDANSPRDSAVALPMNTGQMVWIRVSKFASGMVVGRFKLHVSFEAIVANDNCAAAEPAAVGGVPLCTISATTDGPEEPTCGFDRTPQIGSDIWYCYTSPCTGVSTVSLCESGFDTRLAVYDGCSCSRTGPPIVCDDNGCGTQSMATFASTSGHQYLIRVGGSGAAQGAGTLSLTCTTDGACCMSTGCAVTTPLDCEVLGGRYQGYSTTCDGDADGDEIADACDICPNTVPGSPVDEYGCPPVIPGDFNRDGDVDPDDLGTFQFCASGADLPYPLMEACQRSDFNIDGDVDADDFGVFQRCYSGTNRPANPGCAT